MSAERYQFFMTVKIKHILNYIFGLKFVMFGLQYLFKQKGLRTTLNVHNLYDDYPKWFFVLKNEFIQ